MRFDCLPSSTFPSEFASREVVPLLDHIGTFESESCEDVGKLRDGGIGATIGLGKSSYRDCAYAVFTQNKKPSAIAAQALAKRKIVPSDWARLMDLFTTVTTDGLVWTTT